MITPYQARNYKLFNRALTEFDGYYYPAQNKLIRSGVYKFEDTTLLVHKAASLGFINSLKFFMPLVLNKKLVSETMCMAARYNHIECLEYILSRMNVKKNGNGMANEALIFAVMAGNFDAVKSLISHSNPKQDNSVILTIASAYGHREIFSFLLPFCDVKSAIMYTVEEDIKDYFGGIEPIKKFPAISPLEEIKENYRTRKNIEKELSLVQSQTQKRKM